MKQNHVKPGTQRIRLVSLVNFAFFLLFVPVLASCSLIDRATSESNIPPAPTPTFTFSSLSGRVGVDGPVIAVKIDDTEPARPQIGLLEADVVYIEQVEGGATRLAAIYSSRVPATIGPVRSARISDLELLEQYGKVAFAFSGAQSKLRPVIDSADLFNVGAEREGQLVYSRDPERRAPWNMILNTKPLFERIAKRELQIVQAKPMGWSFGKRNQSGEKIVTATVRWPATRYEISWSRDFKGWLINQNGDPKVDARDIPIVASTFVAQVVSITDSEYGDKFGGRTPLVTSVGSGQAYIFRDGRVIPGTWQRENRQTGTTFLDESGAEIPFKAGQIWIALVAKAPEITYPEAPAESEGASPTPTK